MASSPQPDVPTAAFPRLSSAQPDYFSPCLSLWGHLFMFTVGEGGCCKHSSPGWELCHCHRAAAVPWERLMDVGAQLCPALLALCRCSRWERVPNGLSKVQFHGIRLVDFRIGAVSLWVKCSDGVGLALPWRQSRARSSALILCHPHTQSLLEPNSLLRSVGKSPPEGFLQPQCS